MRNLKTAVTLLALASGLISTGVFGADSATPADPANPAIPGISSADPANPAGPAGSAAPLSDTTASTGNNGTDQKKDSPGGQMSDEIRKTLDAANKARADFIKKQEELRSALPGATRQAREQIRAQIQEQREAFLVQQRQAREDLRKKVVALKEQLKHHQDAIDSAKDDAKPKGHTRKDG